MIFKPYMPLEYTPSKSRRQKCEKGLHQYKRGDVESGRDGKMIAYSVLTCIHCGTTKRA